MQGKKKSEPHAEDCTNHSPKSLTEKKERVTVSPVFYKQQSLDFEVLEVRDIAKFMLAS